MSTHLDPYLHFKDNARQAMQFYQSVFGGDLRISTFQEFHAAEDPSEADKVMHAELETGNGIHFMGSDTPNRMPFEPGASITMSLSGENEAELRSYYEKLSAGGIVTLPLEKAPWGDTFGMLTDKFGIEWMVDITVPKG